MVLIDANILAHMTIEGARSDAARKLLASDGDWHSEAFIMVELTNILATAVRVKILQTQEAYAVLERAEILLSSTLHRTAHSDVLRAAHEYNISAYDARYIALAQKLDLPLITEDRKLRKAVPQWTISLDEALSGL